MSEQKPPCQKALSSVNPFREFDGRTIEFTQYYGGWLEIRFADGTSGYIDVCCPTHEAAKQVYLTGKLQREKNDLTSQDK